MNNKNYLSPIALLILSVRTKSFAIYEKFVYVANVLKVNCDLCKWI